MVGPVNFQLIKIGPRLQSTSLRLARALVGVDVGKEGGAASVGGYPCPLPFGSMSLSVSFAINVSQRAAEGSVPRNVSCQRSSALVKPKPPIDLSAVLSSAINAGVVQEGRTTAGKHPSRESRSTRRSEPSASGRSRSRSTVSHVETRARGRVRGWR